MSQNTVQLFVDEIQSLIQFYLQLFYFSCEIRASHWTINTLGPISTQNNVDIAIYFITLFYTECKKNAQKSRQKV